MHQALMQDPPFPLPLQRAPAPHLNMRALIFQANPLEFPLMRADVSVQCLESVCDLVRDRWTRPGAQRGRDLAHRSWAAPQHSGCGALTHPLSVVWDGVEVGVNWGLAMEKLVLLSVSENDEYEREREKQRWEREIKENVFNIRNVNSKHSKFKKLNLKLSIIETIFALITKRRSCVVF